MRDEVGRLASWWATLVVGLALVTLGVFGYLLVLGDVNWYGTEVSSYRKALSQDQGEYVRIVGRIALNTSEDVVIEQVEVEKAVWTAYEYDYFEERIYLEDAKGNSVLVLFGHVYETKPGRHDGDYHRGDEVCVGGYVTRDRVGIPAVRADFVAKHPEDTPARYASAFAGCALAGMMTVLAFALARLFLHPRRAEAPDWRGT